MSGITTHVLDTAAGAPARGVPISLEQQSSTGWAPLGHGETDADGRLRTLLPAGHPLAPGVYRLTFDVGAYQRARGTGGFYPRVTVEFEVQDGAQHYHVPLLLSPFGYSTYRGS
jgi:5-hydroxyisourate hydrolase